MLPTKFQLNPTYGLGGDVVWRISRWRLGGHLGYRNGTILAILHLYVIQCLPSSFSSIQLTVWEMWFQDFQDGRHGCHLGYQNRTIIPILNLYLTTMPPIKFGSIWHMVWEEMLFGEFQRQPSWISEWNDSSNSDSLCHSNASHQVWAQSDLRFGRRCPLKNFKITTMAAILDIGSERF